MRSGDSRFPFLNREAAVSVEGRVAASEQGLVPDSGRVSRCGVGESQCGTPRATLLAQRGEDSVVK